MPVIARDYWLSLFVGNSLYLVAFAYYFVITFLGYNGTFRSLPLLLLCLFPPSVTGLETDTSHSSTFSSPHAPPSLPCRSHHNTLVYQSLHFESPETLCPCSMGRCRFEKVCIGKSGSNIPFHTTHKSNTKFYIYSAHPLSLVSVQIWKGSIVFALRFAPFQCLQA